MNADKSNYRLIIAGLFLFVNLTLGINVGVISPIIPLIVSDYGITMGQAGLLISMVMIVQALLSIPTGFLIRQTSATRIFGIGWLFSSILILSPLINGFYWLLALRGIFGISVTLIWPSMAPMLKGWFGTRELPVMISLTLAVFAVGAGIGIIVAVPISKVLGWELMLAVVATPLLVGAILWLIAGRAPSPTIDHVTITNWREVLVLLKSRTTLLIAMGDGSALGLYIALTTWLPTFFYDVRGMDLVYASFLTSLLPFAGVVAVLGSGVLMIRTRRRRPFIIFSGIFLGLAGFGTFLFDNQALIYSSLIVVGICSFFYIAPMFTLPLELENIDPRNASVVWATAIGVASVFGIVSPLTVGFIVDEFGTFTPAFIARSVIAFLLLVAGLLLPETAATVRNKTDKRFNVEQ